MLFNSLPFLFFFLPITYFVFWRLRARSSRYVWLTVTGYAFYSFWDYRFCALMALSTLISYTAGLAMLRWPTGLPRRLALWVPIVLDLSLLGYFKYAGFTLTSFQGVASWLGYTVDVPSLNIVLPVGISFYTFHTITYIVDCYRGVITPTRNLAEFSSYVSLFAQLVAGPIVRFRQIEADLDDLEHARDRRDLERAWSFFTLGLIKKVLIADAIASVIDPALANPAALTTLDAWLAAVGYTYQLYFDFSGYSDMAVGLGLMFGLRLPQNFDSPYKADGLADFWRRWHISLSTVLRDYLYIPLGGNRRGVTRTYVNLLVTMVIGGLWHGAAWTFVAWGAYHGALLALERACGTPWQRVPRPVRQAVTFLLVVVGWVLFRSTTYEMATAWLHRMFVPEAGGRMMTSPVLPLALAVAAIVAHTRPNTFELSHRWNGAAVAGLAGLFLAVMAVLYSGHQTPFLYFQF
jgi:alginate O-acetyltransferase complex protein AlgI